MQKKFLTTAVALIVCVLILALYVFFNAHREASNLLSHCHSLRTGQELSVAESLLGKPIKSTAIGDETEYEFETPVAAKVSQSLRVQVKTGNTILTGIWCGEDKGAN